MQLTNFPLQRPTNQNINNTIPLKANLIPISINKTPISYYNISFEPQIHKSRIHSLFMQIVNNKKDLFPNILAFDGVSILITKDELPYKEKNIIFEMGKGGNRGDSSNRGSGDNSNRGDNNRDSTNNNSNTPTNNNTTTNNNPITNNTPTTTNTTTNTSKHINMSVVHKHTLDLSDILKPGHSDIPLLTQCFEIITRQHQLLNYISEGRRCYSNMYSTSLSKGLQVYTGLTHSLKMTLKGPLLNVDTSFCVFYEECTLLSFLIKMCNKSRGSNIRDNKRGRRGGDRDRDNSNRYGDRDTNTSNTPYNNNNTSNTDDTHLLSSLSPDFFRNVSRYLKNVKLVTTHRTRNTSFKLHDISSSSASDTYFEMSGTSKDKISVSEYFSKTYFTLKYPFLPTVIIKKQDKLLYVPIEVCKICSNQKYIRKLDEVQVSEMIRIAALPPLIRFNTIQSRIRDMNICDNKESKAFNVNFGNDFIDIKGKQMEVPSIKFGNTETKPQRGSWNLRGVTALNPVTVNNWCVVLLTNDKERDVNNYINSLIRISYNYGVKLNNKYNIYTCDNPKKYMDILNKNKYMLCIVILRDRSSSIYNVVKRISETKYGVITQCIRRVNMEKLMDATFCSNIAIKINAKLGGVNYKLGICTGISLFSNDTIVFGADVSHPGVGDLESPSIVAVVCSLNGDLTSYSTIMRTQSRRQEIIGDLKEIVKEMLIRYRSSKNVIPKRIIFFRDGVGDTQMYSVFESEICAIKDACLSLDGKYVPDVTFIVAQKRHSIRFMSGGRDVRGMGSSGDVRGGDSSNRDSNRDSSNRDSVRDTRDGNSNTNRNISRNTGNISGNVVPGTVVEEIGHPLSFDFYMVSHYALQGTARPVRYHILYDDSKFNINEIQQYIHNMCYLYARATKAVSVVPPIYYAHLAAARAKCYFEKSDEVFEMKVFEKKLENTLFYL